MELTSWYVLAVTAGREQKVKKTILNRLERRAVTVIDLELVCPEEEVIVSDGKVREKKMKLQLPGYILLKCRNLNTDGINTITSAAGVMGFLGPDDKPTKLPHAQVLKMLGESGNVRRIESLFTEGDEVTITEGPFSDFSAKITEVNMDAENVHVNIEIFGRVTPAQVSLHHIKQG